MLIIFEFKESDSNLGDDLLQTFPITAFKTTVNSISGDSVVQIILSVTALSASISSVILKYLELKKCTIKMNGIEVSALTPEKALATIKKILEETSGDSNE